MCCEFCRVAWAARAEAVRFFAGQRLRGDKKVDAVENAGDEKRGGRNSRKGCAAVESTGDAGAGEARRTERFDAAKKVEGGARGSEAARELEAERRGAGGGKNERERATTAAGIRMDGQPQRLCCEHKHLEGRVGRIIIHKMPANVQVCMHHIFPIFLFLPLLLVVLPSSSHPRPIRHCRQVRHPQKGGQTRP